MDSQDVIRDRIAKFLKEKGLGVKPASVAAGLGETTLRNFLKGMTASLTVESVAKLADSLGVSSRWILYGDTAKVADLVERIDAKLMPQAIAVLEAFAKSSNSDAA